MLILKVAKKVDMPQKQPIFLQLLKEYATIRPGNNIVIENNQGVVDIKGDEINIKDEFIASLLSVVIGTTRGMMIKNTMGKKINEYYLPMLNPKELLKNIKSQK